MKSSRLASIVAIVLALPASVLLGHPSASCIGGRPGWVTDSECGVNGATTTHTQACATAVLERGGELLFYSENDKQLYRIADPIAAFPHIGKRVVIDAHVEMVIHSYADAPLE